MDILYRIEHPVDGLGFFRSINTIGNYRRLSKLAYRWSTYGGNVFPTPQQEGYPIEYRNRYSFLSKRDMEKYILPSEIRILIRLGYRIYKIGLNKSVRTPRQGIYRIEDLIFKEDITSLYLIKKKIYAIPRYYRG